MRVGVLLNGSGHRDGSEIHEAVFTLLALERLGFEVQCCAVDSNQAAVIDHVSGKVMAEQRNMLHESARIARGKIVPIETIKAQDLDGIMIPGGSGTARNLCNFQEKGADMAVQPQVLSLIEEMFGLRKPIGAICIAPVLLAKALGKHKVRLTLGAEGPAADAVKAMGAIHVVCASGECVIDREHRIVTSPAYMYDNATMVEVLSGIQKAAEALQAFLR